MSNHKVSVVAPFGDSSIKENDETVKVVDAELMNRKPAQVENGLSSGLASPNRKCSDCENGLDSSFEGEYKLVQTPVQDDGSKSGASSLTRHRALIRRKSTLFDNRTAIGKYIDVFWRKEIEMKMIESRFDIDQAVHNRISKMLYMGQMDNVDEEDPESYVDKAKHRNDNLLKHQEEIIAIKEAIKPGFCGIFCQPFDREIIRNYFERLSLEDIDEHEEQERLEQKLEREVNEEALLMQDKKVSVGKEEVR